MSRIAVFLLALAGCDRVFGLEPVGDASAALPSLVTGHWFARTATLAGDHVAIADSTFAASRVTLAARFEDGSSAPVSYDETSGELSFAVPAAGTRYRLLISVDGGIEEIQHTAARLAIVSPVIGRTNRVPVTQPTPLTFAPSMALAPTQELVTLGVWTDTFLAGNTFDWLATGASLIDTSAGDRVFFNQAAHTPTMDGKLATTIVGAGEITPMVLRDGAPQSFPVAIVPRQPDRCVHLTADRDVQGRQLVAAYAPTFTGFVQDWAIYAIAHADLGFIAASNVTYTAGEPVDPSAVDIVPRFWSPFPEPLAATAGVAIGRTVTIPGAAPSAAIYAGNRTIDLVPANATCATGVPLRTHVGMPGTVTIDDTALDHDGVAAAIDRTRLAKVTWNLAVEGTVDRAEVTLVEVLRDAFGRTSLVARSSFRTVDREVWIDPAQLVRDHYYVLRIDVSLGYPDAPGGDFTRPTFPAEGGTGWSMLFRIAS